MRFARGPALCSSEQRILPSSNQITKRGPRSGESAQPPGMAAHKPPQQDATDRRTDTHHPVQTDARENKPTGLKQLEQTVGERERTERFPAKMKACEG